MSTFLLPKYKTHFTGNSAKLDSHYAASNRLYVAICVINMPLLHVYVHSH